MLFLLRLDAGIALEPPDRRPGAAARDSLFDEEVSIGVVHPADGHSCPGGVILSFTDAAVEQRLGRWSTEFGQLVAEFLRPGGELAVLGDCDVHGDLAWVFVFGEDFQEVVTIAAG